MLNLLLLKTVNRGSATFTTIHLLVNHMHSCLRDNEVKKFSGSYSIPNFKTYFS